MSLTHYFQFILSIYENKNLQKNWKMKRDKYLRILKLDSNKITFFVKSQPPTSELRNCENQNSFKSSSALSITSKINLHSLMEYYHYFANHIINHRFIEKLYNFNPPKKSFYKTKCFLSITLQLYCSCICIIVKKT